MHSGLAIQSSLYRTRIDGGIVAPFERDDSKGVHMSAKRLLVAGIPIGVAVIFGHAQRGNS